MDEKLVEKCAEAIYAEANKQTTYVGDYRFPDGEGTDTCLDGDFDLAGFARAVLSCIEENGMVVVPKEATAAMGDAGLTAFERWERGESDRIFPMKEMWAAFISASPKG